MSLTIGAVVQALIEVLPEPATRGAMIDRMDAISDKISDITNVKLSDTQLATVLTSLVELKEIVPGYPVQSPSEDVNLEADLLRHCGIQPDDDWVKRVERLNGIIDVMREERGEVVA